VWLARDFLARARRPVDIPACAHDTTDCPPIREGATEMTTTPTWRDYSIHHYGSHDHETSVLCRSDNGCEDFTANADGRYLTLGEAVDWAQKHATQHAEWVAEAGQEDDLGDFDLDNI
jgi:hypothetical protein